MMFAPIMSVFVVAVPTTQNAGVTRRFCENATAQSAALVVTVWLAAGACDAEKQLGAF